MKNLEDKQIQELKSHQSIPYGGWTFLSGAATVCALLAVAVYIARHEVTTLGYSMLWVKWTIYTLIVYLPEVCLVVFMISGTRAKWFLEYKDRNIIGHEARFQLDFDWKKEERSTCVECGIFSRKFLGKRLCMTGFGCMILLPLGGWFTWPRIVCDEKEVAKRLAGWSVRLHEISEKGGVTVEVRYRKERIICDIATALLILQFVGKKEMVGKSWSAIISHLHDSLEKTQEEQRTARKELEKTQRELEGARRAEKRLEEVHEQAGRDSKCYLELLERTIQRLDATKRFIKSSQAQEIREDLVRELVRRLPYGDPRTAQYRAQYQAMLAKKEQRAAAEAKPAPSN